MLQELAPCTCGMLYGSCGGGCGGAAAAASAFSLLFPVAGGQYYYRQCGAAAAEEESRRLSPYGGGGGAVDCTLSLGTPSTRRAEAGAYAHATTTPPVGGGLPSARSGGKQDGGGAGAASCKEAPAGRLPRRCANCDTTSTPLWRNGPRGPKSLCNACGIRYKKEERRAAAAVAPAPPLDTGAGYAYCYPRQPPAPSPQWGCYGQAAAAKSASYAMFGDIVDAADDGPCLSWRLNMMPSSPAFAVGERPGLFQYY
ncbi:GATA transcription factor 15-like [Oryza brachyantha]|uniref:GATA transcription factor 15-like n=1 Tax=Oryza brachyantha TaxID=4533 RepID=UPI001AD962C6|nr:GATA transcription factor 15-like [Oryza brachyantha]